MKIIYIGAGCFWGTQGYFNQIKGVNSTSVGFANGGKVGVSYEEVSVEKDHAEVVKIEYDETVLTMKDIFMLHMHIIDPFAKDRQANDVGHQYRTGFYSEDQMYVTAYKEILTEWESENSNTEIEVSLLTDYTDASEEHQDYLMKNPQGYCHININDIPEGFKKAT